MIRVPRFLASLLALVVPLAVSGCGGGDGNPTGPGGGGPSPSVSITLSSATINVIAGQTGQVTVNVARAGGFSGAVTLSVEGPSGVTAQPVTVAGGATSGVLTLQVGGSVAAGTLQATVRATGQGVEQASATLSIVVAAAPVPDFTLAANPATLSIERGSSATVAVQITRSGGFAGAVTLTATGLPGGVTATFDPGAPTGTSSTLTLTAAAGAAIGNATVTITGNAAGINPRSTQLGLSVTPGGGGGVGNVAWAFCEYAGIPVWLAFRDGDGPWTRVTGDDENVYRFQVDGSRGAVAYVTEDDGAPLTQVFLFTREEMVFVGQNQCEGVEVTRTVNGSVTGLGPLETAFISMGSGFATVSGAQGNTFSMTNVEGGPQNLLAARATFDLSNPQNPSLAANRMIIRRGLNPPDGGTLAPLDFNAEGFAPATGNVTVNGLAGGESVVLTGLFTTTRGSIGAYFTGIGGAATQTAYGVPADRLEAGDLHFLQVATTQLNPAPGQVPATRQAGIGFREMQDRTVTLGPSLASPTVTSVGTAANARLRAQWTLQPEYNRFVYFVASQFGASGDGRQVSVAATEAYLQGATMADLEVPDLSGLDGWQSRWSLLGGVSTTWNASGSGWQGTGFINFPELVDGTVYRSATRSGQLTP